LFIAADPKEQPECFTRMNSQQFNGRRAMTDAFADFKAASRRNRKLRHARPTADNSSMAPFRPSTYLTRSCVEFVATPHVTGEFDFEGL
jgi:hypothetical protein